MLTHSFLIFRVDYLIPIVIVLLNSWLFSGCALFDMKPEIDRGNWDAPANQGDVSLGMSMNQVESNWGAPRQVFVAGTDHDGNQKWVYPESTSSPYGLGRSRVVYFERGQVSGWDTQ